MGKRLALALVALALLAAGLFVYLADAGGSDRRAAGPVPDAGATGGGAPADLAAPGAAPDAAAPAQPLLPEPERVEVSATSRRTGEDPWSASRSGLRGRLVESDGRPAAGFEVTLQELDPSLLFTTGEPDPGGSGLQVAATRTDAQGRFLLEGARRDSFHALGIELGKPRGTLRLVEAAVNPGEVTDLGDVVLEPYGVFTGRVVDARSRPVAGARVRVSNAAPEVLEAGLQEFRGTSLAAVVEGPLEQVLEPPAWIRSAADRLPVPTTRTDAQGSFRLEGVPLDGVILAVDRPGLATHVDRVDATAGGERDLGAITLEDGRRVAGIVVDTAGAPVACEDVYVGATVPLGELVILQHAGPAGADGRFELTGLPAEGELFAAARRNARSPWELEGPLVEGVDVALRLPVTAGLTVRLRDAAGNPVRTTDLIVAPADTSGMRGMGVSMLLGSSPRTPGEGVREVEPGTLLCEGLAPGPYQVTARAPGFAATTAEVEVAPGGSETELRLEAGVHQTFRVVDAATGAPVGGARVHLVEMQWLTSSPLAEGVTDAEGRVRLGPVPAGLAGEGGGAGRSELMSLLADEQHQTLRVEHPSYPATVVPVGELSIAPDAGPDTPRLVPLEAGGALVGRVHDGGAPPAEPVMLSLEAGRGRGFASIMDFPRLTLTDPDGGFRVTGLVAGDYDVNVFERFLDGDLLGRMRPELDPQRLARVETTVLPGQTTVLDVNLAAGASGPTATLRGSVRVAGRPVVGATVRVEGERRRSVETDDAGRFDAGQVAASQSVGVRIEAVIETSEGVPRELDLYRDALVLEPGEVRELEIVHDLHELDVVLLERGSGQPVGGMEVRVQGTQDETEGLADEALTDATGRVRLVALRPGTYALRTGGDGWIQHTRSIEVEPTPAPPRIVVELDRGVTVAGRIQVAGGVETGRGFSYLWARAQEQNADGMVVTASARIGRRDLEFELEGLLPGSYVAEIILAGQRGEEVEFQVGPADRDDLVLLFTPAGQ